MIMKKILIVLILCGVNLISFGQVVNNCNLILNNDSSSLNATLEGKQIILNFQKTDVLSITFEELKTDISKKMVVITSDSNHNEILIGTFNKTDIKGDSSYTLDIPFGKLDKLCFGTDNIYTILIKDEKGEQILLRFKLLKE